MVTIAPVHRATHRVNQQPARKRLGLDARMQLVCGIEWGLAGAIAHQFDPPEKATPADVAHMRVLAKVVLQQPVQVLAATTVDLALARMVDAPDVLVVDYHLHDRLDGLDTLDALRAACGDVPGALLTADGSDVLKRNARLRGYRVLTKPIKPASLRAFLASVRT